MTMTMSIPNADMMSIEMKIDYIIVQAVQRATDAILAEANPEVNEKESRSKDYDEVTSADYAAQDAIISVISNLMPEAGMIAEEKNFSKASTNGYTFVFDPIDGTKEFVRKGNEVGVMIGCLYQGRVIAAAIHNPFTSERYTLLAKTGKVYRHRSAGKEIRLDFGDEQNFKRHPRNNPLLTLDDMRGEEIGAIASLSEPKYGFFNPHLISTGSYGTNLMKLASNQVCAVITKANIIWPWDAIPVFGILNALGFCSYQLQEDSTWKFQKLRFDTSQYNEGILLITHPDVFADLIFDCYDEEQQLKMVKSIMI
jgi:fructose-1,6-bisphosphatase/inositol monophosphatase family enzyme